MAKKQTTKSIEQKIIDAYMDYKLMHGHEPASVYKFAKELKIKEVDFYNHFNSFSALNKHIWKYFAQETIDTLHEEEAFYEYSAREKLLAFYFTLIEVLKENRSYALMDLQKIQRPSKNIEMLSAFKHVFHSFIDELLMQAKETEEVMDRPLIGDQYSKGLWVQTVFVLQFWSKDESNEFEKTDAAIEKAVNVAFDLMGKSPLDSIFDFGKFIFQNK